jgi:hypothetical protein
MGFFVEEAKGTFQGHEIAATVVANVIQGSLDAKLYIDGQVVDSSHAVPKGIGFLKGQVSAEGKSYIVEVFAVGWFNRHLIIKIDGKELARSA